MADARFTPQARRLWDALDGSTRQRILGNVWCAACERSVSIADWSGRVRQGDIVLSGTCRHCGAEVSRLVETGWAARQELIERCRPFFTGEVRERQRIPAGTRVPVVLTEAERDLIVEHVWGSKELGDAIAGAEVDAGALGIDVSLDELDELVGCLAAAANHEQRRAVQRRLESLCDQLSDIEGSYEKAEE